jgi:hypothetical protein
MISENLDTRTGTLEIRPDGILHARTVPGSVVSLEDARENLASLPARPDHGRQLLMLDLRGMNGMSREAREFYAGEEPARVLAAIALIVDSPLSRMIGSFFLGFNKPRIPLRLFTSEAQALRWLKRFTE